MKTLAYFDNAATTYIKPKIVHDFMHEFYMSNSINVGRGLYSLSSEASFLIADTRKRLLNLFHATTEYEAILVSSATEAINIILQGTHFNEGDNIYLSPFEHNAVYRTAKYLESTRGIKICYLDVDKESLEYKFDTIRYSFNQKPPAMIIVTHVSNVCGNISPIEKMGELAKQYHSDYLIDCAQSAGLIEIDINKVKADYIVFAGHKTLYGPFGCSGFICKKSSPLKPLVYGGAGIDSANELMPSDMPARFEAGSQNILSIAGLNAAIKWHEEIGIDKLQKTEKENYDRLYELLTSISKIKIIGKSKHSASILSCTLRNISPDIAGKLLLDRNIIVRTGLHCAPLAHKFLDTFPEGTVRFSINYFTTPEEFDILEKALKSI